MNFDVILKKHFKDILQKKKWLKRANVAHDWMFASNSAKATIVKGRLEKVGGLCLAYMFSYRQQLLA
jgi:hypothetical protein